jgi:hypothetical protein
MQAAWKVHYASKLPSGGRSCIGQVQMSLHLGEQCSNQCNGLPAPIVLQQRCCGSREAPEVT